MLNLDTFHKPAASIQRGQVPSREASYIKRQSLGQVRDKCREQV
jgi:hypothetical protein